MSPFVAHLITRVSITVTAVLLLFMAVIVQIKDDIPRTVCMNMTLEECNAVLHGERN